MKYQQSTAIQVSPRFLSQDDRIEIADGRAGAR
jgi:hypothetical protein